MTERSVPRHAAALVPATCSACYRFDGTNPETFVYTANDERVGVLKGTE